MKFIFVFSFFCFFFPARILLCILVAALCSLDSCLRVRSASLSAACLCGSVHGWFDLVRSMHCCCDFCRLSSNTHLLVCLYCLFLFSQAVYRWISYSIAGSRITIDWTSHSFELHVTFIIIIGQREEMKQTTRLLFHSRIERVVRRGLCRFREQHEKR